MQTGFSCKLSKREHEIMLFVTKGLSAKEISREINRCQRTVERHLVSIKEKLQARNIAHAVALFYLHENRIKNTNTVEEYMPKAFHF